MFLFFKGKNEAFGSKDPETNGFLLSLLLLSSAKLCSERWNIYTLALQNIIVGVGLDFSGLKTFKAKLLKKKKNAEDPFISNTWSLVHPIGTNPYFARILWIWLVP